MQEQEGRNSVALYWSAVSLIVCEGLPADQAAERLGLPWEALRELMHQRQASTVPTLYTVAGVDIHYTQ